MSDNGVLLRLKQSTRVRTRGLALLETTRSRMEEAQTRRLLGRYSGWRREPVRERTVLYEAFAGNGVLCNPEAVFRHLLAAPGFADLTHVWVLDDPAKHPRVVGEFAGDDRVRFVERLSAEYFEALATSKYLFNNATFPSEFVKRPEQVYVNTWHGVPLKTMGYDTPDGPTGSRNILRNFVAADYLLSANEFMTDVMYRRAFRLQGIHRGFVVEEGQPRTDRQAAAPGPVTERLREAGLDTQGRRIVLFAPTWRGSSFNDPMVNAGQLTSTVRDLQRRLGNEYVVLLKAHQTVHDRLVASGKAGKVLVPNEIPTNELLGATAVLVSDYSSIFFDFLATGRPVLHYAPDLDEYVDSRGLYLEPSELPGPVSHTVEELAEQLLEAVAADAPSAQYAKAAARFAAHDDGGVAARVVDLVFNGADPATYRTHRLHDPARPSLLIYLGSLASMGITSSALNLLANLDYERYDVSVFYQHSEIRDRLNNAAQIDPRARVFPRFGTYAESGRRVSREKRLMSVGLPEQPDRRHQQFWEDEWRRMFGMSEFDHVVDFSGFGTFCPFLFTATPGSTRSLWLHSDMMAESQRNTEGDKHLEGRLNAVFTTFRYFDHLVSVSKELNDVNATKLAPYADPSAFTHASNTIDQRRILGHAGVDEHGKRVTGPPGTFDTAHLPAALASLLDHFDARSIVREARARARMAYIPRRDDEHVTFVAVGRLSPEKNHARLVRAFAEVHERHPHTRLVIMGDGRLMPTLVAQVENLGLTDYVSLPGRVDNPYAIMADCDCFVMSSTYEGLPMTILEARTLDLPVVSTRFPSVADSLPEGAGLVVEQSDEALVAGMERFLDGEVPRLILDGAAYNAQAMREFYRAIGADPAEA